MRVDFRLIVCLFFSIVSFVNTFVKKKKEFVPFEETEVS